MTIDNRGTQLDELLRQEPRLQTITGAVFDLLRSLDAIEAQQYQPKRTDELKRERTNKAAAAVAAEMLRLDAEVALVDNQTLDAFNANAQSRARSNAPARVVDVKRCETSSAPELSLLLDEAATSGDLAYTRDLWFHCERRLRDLSAREMGLRADMPTGQHINGAAFHVWTTWKTKMQRLIGAHPDRAAAVQRQQHARTALRAKVLQAAAVLGVEFAQAVELAERRAAVVADESTVSSRLTVGGFFDWLERK